MKSILKILTIMLFMSVLLETSNAQVLWRSAKTMKKGSFIMKSRVYYKDFSKKYIEDKWQDNPITQKEYGSHFMFGYALTNRLEVMAHIPYYARSFDNGNDSETAWNVGDIYLKTRYAFKPWSKKTNGLTIIGMLRLPTGFDANYRNAAADTSAVDKSINKYLKTGDGSTDYGLGAMFSTRWKYNLRGHLKGFYWFNQENDDEIKSGDELKFIAKIDYSLHKTIMLFTSVVYYKMKNMKFADINQKNSDKWRTYLQLGATIKPKRGVFIRPKLVYHAAGENKIIFNIQPVLDAWYVF